MLPYPFDDQPSQVKTKVITTYVVLIGGNIFAWLWAWIAFADRPALLGMALLAYMFGLRHAFDADHIAAIDNVVRKLMQEGKTPYSVGFFFSLGHSTIVIIASITIAAMAASVQRRLDTLHEIGGMIGTSISALFLFLIGFANLFVLKNLLSALARVRRGDGIADEEFDALLSSRGFIARIFRPMFKIVSRSWHMYPIGFLFGTGFDTATEIGVLAIAATQAAQGTSFWTILIFPTLFAVGMSLMDTTDSALMVGAYGWAFLRPVRKLWYNLTITFVSVVVAVLIGTIEVLGLAVRQLQLSGRAWDAVRALADHFTMVGYGVVGIFLMSWAGSILIYQIRRYDQLDAVLARPTNEHDFRPPSVPPIHHEDSSEPAVLV